MLHKLKSKSGYSRAIALMSLVVFICFTSVRSIAATGEELYKTNCAACHKLSDAKFVGPGLKDVTKKRTMEWLVAWTKNSQNLIASGDSAAIAIFEEYNKTVMTAFEGILDDSAIISIFNYGDAANSGEQIAATVQDTTLTESVPAAMVAEPTDPGKPIVTIFMIILFVIIVYVLYGTYKSVHKAMDETGYLDYKNINKNYLVTFLAILGLTTIVIFFLTEALASNSPGLNMVMFGALPYAVLVIFIVGSIFRYKNIGFKVSSLSTQFLEGRQLFFGSQPFHWGLLVLFFGHLIAFMVPKAVILWNGHPVRLLILEVTSLAFAIAALVGLILLIKRRFSNKRVMVVTNNMDTLVYVILLVQIVSGISIAVFARWGSTWFASSLTPYLRSIFTFDPQVGVASAMPWYAQIHIISAFFIIAIIPFTRFMHFLVAPIDYAWRKYQIVYWNWNRKSIRKSTSHTYGKPTRNH